MRRRTKSTEHQREQEEDFAGVAQTQRSTEIYDIITPPAPSTARTTHAIHPHSRPAGPPGTPGRWFPRYRTILYNYPFVDRHMVPNAYLLAHN